MRAAFVLALLLAGSARAAEGVTITFPAAGDAGVVHVGPMAAAPAHAHGARRGAFRREQILVRLERGTGGRGFARLSARLDADAAGWRVRVAGVTLSPAPQVIDASARLGSTTAYVLEIEVPESAPPGPFALPITWLAEAG